MRIYFLSEIPAALFVGGAYLGRVDGFERSAQIDCSEPIFLEFLPSGDYSPLRFFLSEETLFAPPEGVSMYRSGEEIALFAHSYTRVEQSLHVLWQDKINGTLLTLCRQGKLQLNVENDTGFYLLYLPDGLQKSKPTAWADGFLLESETHFAYVTRTGELPFCSEGKILSRGGTLKAEVPFHDCLAHVAVYEWEEKNLLSCSVRTPNQPTEATYALALFQSVLIGADATPYLDDTLKQKASSLKEFLGAFTSVVLTDEPTRIGLIYPVRERVFEVRYFRVQITDGKISNVTPE